MLAPIAAFADGGKSGSDGKGDSTYVAPGLLDKANQDGNKDNKLHVIVQSTGGVAGAEDAIHGIGANERAQLNLIGAIAIDVTAGKLKSLAKQPGLIITPDSPVHSTGGITSTQLWPYASGVSSLWGTGWGSAPVAPTIAVVDSGIDASRVDFAGRLYPQVNLSSLTPNAVGDDRGHGTFVAGIAAGSAAGYGGASPTSRILPIRVMDQNGVALTSDVIQACQWILANKATYNIRVANFSLHSGTATHFYFDPLDRAVEKLWFNGVTVVAAAGNYGSATGPSGVPYSPGNDPFVITVGAVDVGTSLLRSDDSVAPWSAYGYTEDGFAKPEVGAPGRYMVGPVSANATLALQRPDHIVAPGYMQLSGTSFAAPVVAGSAAQILARHPGWTPDQVKGALMLTAKPVPLAAPNASGVGEIAAASAAALSSAPNPNTAIERFVAADPAGGGVTFDYASWAALAQANASWNDASWADASWNDASWNDASWADASWNDASWNDASWADASWADASWTDASWADSAHEDGALDGTKPLPAFAPSGLTAQP